MKRDFSAFSRKTLYRFVAGIILILIGSFLLTGALAVLLFKLGFLTHKMPVVIFVYFIITSAIIASRIAILVGRRYLKPITDIERALKCVANGDFSVQLEEDSKTPEVAEMARSFNLMTKELQNNKFIHSDFITNVSHEIKTPASAIEGYASLIQNKNLTESKREIYAEKIIYNTKRLTLLTDNILKLSKLENQELSFLKSNFSVDEQIREVILMFENEWQKKEIDLEIDLENVNYFGSKEFLFQVWQNIIGNAMKFVEQKGKIKISLTKDEKQVIVKIADNGPGMNDETQKRIFEKFYQGDLSHTSKGSGLGMSIAKRILDLHDGKIEINSSPKNGSVFTVLLPIEENNPGG